MKTKYLQTIVNKLTSLKTGMTSHNDLWDKQEVKVTELDAHIDLLTAIDNEIVNAQNLIVQKRKEARNKAVLANKILKTVNNLAQGLHTNSEIYLNDYGIKKRKPKTRKSIPTKATIMDIKDDFDGEGFIITLAKLADAEYYEWQKAIAANGEELVHPPFPFFKTNKKLTLTDNEVPRGKRCFYRVRAINRTGAGEWSETVSKVQ